MKILTTVDLRFPHFLTEDMLPEITKHSTDLKANSSVSARILRQSHKCTDRDGFQPI